MDGTFKWSPKKFYQIYNIIGKDEHSGIIIPLVFVLISNKSIELYEQVFQYIKYLLDKFNINIDLKDKYIMMDFEKASKKAFNKIFPEAHLWGCYFNYTKSLWKRTKKQGLVKKDLKLDIFILIFTLKLYKFINEKVKKEFLKSFIEAYSHKKEYNQ